MSIKKSWGPFVRQTIGHFGFSSHYIFYCTRDKWHKSNHVCGKVPGFDLGHCCGARFVRGSCRGHLRARMRGQRLLQGIRKHLQLKICNFFPKNISSCLRCAYARRAMWETRTTVARRPAKWSSVAPTPGVRKTQAEIRYTNNIKKSYLSNQNIVAIKYRSATAKSDTEGIRTSDAIDE